MYRGNCVEGGTVHLVVGTGGAQLEKNRYYSIFRSMCNTGAWLLI